MTRESWLDHPAITALSGGIRTRIGVSPNHSSFRVGVLRTHLLTAVLAHAAARLLNTGAAVWVRCDDTDSRRADRKHLPALIEELYEVAAIQTQPQVWYQSERHQRYGEAIVALAQTGALAWVGDVPCLDLHAADELLPGAARRVSSNVVNLAIPPTERSQRLVPLTRRDGTALWHLASVLDDIDARINFVVRGTDKVPALGIQHRLRRLLGDCQSVAYFFLPKLREPGSKSIRVADLTQRLIRPSTIRWYLAEPYLDGTLVPQTFAHLVDQIRRCLPSPRDGNFDQARLAAFDRKISPQLDVSVMASELESVVGNDYPDLIAQICNDLRRPLADQVEAYRRATESRVPHQLEGAPESVAGQGLPAIQKAEALPSGR